MKRKNIVFYVTGQYMRLNKKRTMTMFAGIFLMVLLLTCVFVGKDTAIGFLQALASEKDGKWHATAYGITAQEQEKLEALSYVKESAVSVDLGDTQFEASANEERPYLHVKAYDAPCFDWMNLRLTEGRFPQNTQEIVLSETIRADGAAIAVGDTIEADYFRRAVTGLEREGDAEAKTVFPFFGLTVKAGETVEVPQEFPYYGENNAFRETHQPTGYAQTYRVVGFIEKPEFESTSAAGYMGITLYEKGMAADGEINLSMIFDLKEMPDYFISDMEELADQIETNDYVMVFSADSSNNTINTMILMMTVFLVVVIIAASIILINNIFHLSFAERSRYLGMLSSVGATARQKRSSIYFEAFSLLIPAVPAGVLAGFGVIKGGMLLIKPYLVMLAYTGAYASGLPVRLTVSTEAMAAVIALCIATVLLSSFLPARKIGRIGAVECIRGNFDKRAKTYRLNERGIRRFGVEGMLASNNIKRQRRKTAGIRRAAVVFMVILVVTAFSAEAIRQVADKKTGTPDIDITMEDNEYSLYMFGQNEEDEENFAELEKAVRGSEGIERVECWYLGMFVGKVDDEIYSREYWDAYHEIFNEYYRRELGTEEFDELRVRDSNQLNLVAVDDETLKKIAEAAGADYEQMTDSKTPGIILFSEGRLSTDNVGIEGMTPARYRYYDIKKMTDLQIGDTFSTSIYSAEKEEHEEVPLQVAAVVTNEQMKEHVQVNSQWIWGLVSEQTYRRMNEIIGDETGAPGFDRELRIKTDGTDSEILKKLYNADDKNLSILFRETTYAYMTGTIVKAILGTIDVLLFCFVLLTSLICFINLYNSIEGRMLERQRELAMLESVGMTRRQMRKMLLLECVRILGRSIVTAAVICAGLIWLVQRTLTSLFGRIALQLPAGLMIASVALTAAVMMLFTVRSFGRKQKGTLLENIRRESV